LPRHLSWRLACVHAADELGSQYSPPAFDTAAYRRRTVIERCINRLKQFRRVATRYDKHAVRYRAFVVLAAISLWLAS